MSDAMSDIMKEEQSDKMIRISSEMLRNNPMFLEL